MDRLIDKIRSRRGYMAIIAVILIALVCLWGLSANMFTESTDGSDDDITPEQRPTQWIGPKKQKVVFPVEARSDNPEVNEFIYEFLDILLNGDYKGYRLRVTERREPVSVDKFEQAYVRVRLIRIDAIERVDDPKELQALLGGLDPAFDHAPDDQPLVYRVRVHIASTANVERDVRLYIFREDQRWVSSN